MDQVKEKNCTFPNKYFVFIPNNLYAAFKKKEKKKKKENQANHDCNSMGVTSRNNGMNFYSSIS